MDRRVTVRYYEIVEADHSEPFEDTLERISSIPTRADRERVLGEDLTLRLETLRRHTDIIAGDFTRIQTENLPGSPDADTLNPLRDDKLGHSIAFTFDIPTRTFSIQFHLNAQTSKIIQYISTFTDDSVFVAYPVLNQAMIASLKEKTIKKFEVNVAKVGPYLEATKDEDAHFLRRMNKIAKDQGTERLNVQMSASADYPLTGKTVMQAVKSAYLANSRNNSVRTIKVTTDEDTDVLNFLGGQLKKFESLDLPSNLPEESRKIRVKKLREWHRNHLPYLRTYVKTDD